VDQQVQIASHNRKEAVRKQRHVELTVAEGQEGTEIGP
jgi:hypothetical protein